MTTIEALKNLSIAAGCGEATGDTTAKIINHMAEHYTPPGPTNLFDINGEIDVDYAGEKKNLNTVENGIITSMANSTSNHSVGQLIDTVAGKTYLFKVNVVSVGTGTKGYLGCYPFDSNDGTWKNGGVGSLEMTYTATTDKTLFGFETDGGTGAQFNNISVTQVD